MTLANDVQKLYQINLKLVFALIFYLLGNYIPNETSQSIFLFISIGLGGLVIVELAIYHFSLYSQHKVVILFSLFAVILGIVFLILYKQQGMGILFWSTLIPAILTYFGTLITVLAKS